MSEISGVSGSGPLPSMGATPSEALPAVPPDEVENLEMAVGLLGNLVEEARADRHSELGQKFATQAAREALHVQERIYRLLPAVGVVPNEVALPMGVLPDEVASVDRAAPEQLRPVYTHLPDRLLPQNGELIGEITPEARQLPDPLAPRVAAAYSTFNAILRESGLGEAMRTSSVPRWASTFSPQ